MRWFKIKKGPKPTKGSFYPDWKDDLAFEASNQCVYCTIHTNPFGGIRNFHVEHYRPKSRKEFEHLTNDYNNLFFSCSICNCFKGADWPNEPNDSLDIRCYPDPTVHDYSYLFGLNPDFTLYGTKFASKYMVEKLFLNRPQLQLERRAFAIYEEFKTVFTNLKTQIIELKSKRSKSTSEAESALLDTLIATIEVVIIQNEGRYVNPYTSDQIKK